MAVKTVKTETEAAALEPGEPFIVVGDFPDDPLELLESAAWAEAESLVAAVEQRLTPTRPNKPGQGNTRRATEKGN